MKKYNVQICSRPSSSAKKYDCCKVPATNKNGDKICVLECKECCKKKTPSKTPKQSLCVLKEECCNGKNVYQIVCKDDSDACGNSCCGDQDNSSSDCDDSDSAPTCPCPCPCANSCDMCCMQTCSSRDNSTNSDTCDGCDSEESFVLTAVKSKKKCNPPGTKVFVVKTGSSQNQSRKKCKSSGSNCGKTPTTKFKIIKCCK
ncbi:hypothetical protein WDU94_013641 [Cyamophila willieti]